MDKESFRTEKISRILLHMAPPVMLAQLIQALYNLIDSFFIGRYSTAGLTALSIVYPLQLLMIAIAVGTGVGINTRVSHNNGIQNYEKADATAGIAAPLALVLWGAFALVSFLILPAYAASQTSSPEVIKDCIAYGRVVTLFSPGFFLESNWTKVCQANGDMKTPMAGQILGAVVNILLDPLLIFGWGPLPEFGVAGAGIATVIGQAAAALVVVRKGYRPLPALREYPALVRVVFQAGLPNILMQAAYTVYIFGLNLILAGFSDAAVTTLGLYYKWQTLFFIPLSALQTCIVPVISFNYAAGDMNRCRETMRVTYRYSMLLMTIGVACHVLIPGQMIGVFTSDADVLSIGRVAFRIVGPDFYPMSFALIYPVYFQAIGKAGKSSFLTLFRTLGLMLPVGYLLSLFGLNAFWFTWLVTDTITSLVGILLYRRDMKSPKGPEQESVFTV